ncbi:MAG: CsgG/HfaB family protein [Thermodesulfobacteriota bacterium]|nr:CsgG/HfaB family protein [Thermodesulfobacteriota bacterium]
MARKKSGFCRGWVGILFFSLFFQAIFLSPANSKSVDSALEGLAFRVVEEITKSNKQVLALADFGDLSGNPTEIGRFFSEELLSRIEKGKRIIVVERRDLKKVLEELQLRLSGLSEGRSAKAVGAFLGADVLCTGTVILFAKSLKVNVRLIDTETGEIFATAGVIIDTPGEVEKLKSGIGSPPIPHSKQAIRYTGAENLLTNGGFEKGYYGWKRSIGDLKRGSSQTEIIPMSHTKSGRALRIRHAGEGHIQFHQQVPVLGPDLIFSASFQSTTREGMMVGFSGTGVVQIALQYFDEKGNRLGETVLVNYVKNPFADTPLIGVPRRKPDSYQSHYIEFQREKFHSAYSIDIHREIENNLLGINPQSVRQVAVILWCGATHPQAAAELIISDIILQQK